MLLLWEYHLENFIIDVRIILILLPNLGSPRRGGILFAHRLKSLLKSVKMLNKCLVFNYHQKGLVTVEEVQQGKYYPQFLSNVVHELPGSTIRSYDKVLCLSKRDYWIFSIIVR